MTVLIQDNISKNLAVATYLILINSLVPTSVTIVNNTYYNVTMMNQLSAFDIRGSSVQVNLQNITFKDSSLDKAIYLSTKTTNITNISFNNVTMSSTPKDYSLIYAYGQTQFILSQLKITNMAIKNNEALQISTTS